MMPWFIPIKLIEEISDLSVQRGHVNYTIAPKETYRPPIFV